MSFYQNKNPKSFLKCYFIQTAQRVGESRRVNYRNLNEELALHVVGLV